MNQFTADWHFNDNNILKYQRDRLQIFGNTNKIITKNLINTQNCQVDKNDTVYVLGDFVVSDNIKYILDIVHRLNGKIILILGNHDDILKGKNLDIAGKFIISHDIVEVILYNGQIVYLYHYPLFEQPNYYNKNTYHLHGHTHGDRKHPDSKAIDIGCNIHDFKLLSERKIVDLISINQIN